MRSDTTMPGERDLAAVWASTRTRIGELLGTTPAAAGGLRATTVRGATVRDIIAHLVRTARTAAHGTAEAVAATALSLPVADDVDPAVTMADLLAEWDVAYEGVRDRLAAVDHPIASLLITGAVMSEHDLRTTLDVPGARDDVAVRVALDELSGRFSDRVAEAALPALRVTVEQWGTIVGDGRAVRCVVADRFEFVRAMAGRRSAAEIRRWNWGTDADPYIGVIAEVDLPVLEIRERDPRVPEHMRDREFVL